jgi:short-subunit dehydrogenase
MNVLILGATSNIGQALAHQFSSGNHLFLVGRNSDQLNLLKDRCLNKQAVTVTLLNYDLSLQSEIFLEKLNGINFDILINALSATSRLRDNLLEISSNSFNTYWNIDVLIPIKIVEKIIARSNKLDIIFISTVLSLIDVKDRVVYSSLKNIYSTYLRELNKKNKTKFLIVYVGKVFSYDLNPESEKLNQFAKEVKNGYESGKESLLYGLEGKLFLLVYKLSPIILSFLHKVQRTLRKSKS